LGDARNLWSGVIGQITQELREYAQQHQMDEAAALKVCLLFSHAGHISSEDHKQALD
jgi:hypothetical protein